MDRPSRSGSKWDIHFLQIQEIRKQSPIIIMKSTSTDIISLRTCYKPSKCRFMIGDLHGFTFFVTRASAQSKMWQQLGKRRDREAWEMFPSTVNAYYNPPANEVRFKRLSSCVASETTIDCIPCRDTSTAVLCGKLVNVTRLESRFVDAHS